MKSPTYSYYISAFLVFCVGLLSVITCLNCKASSAPEKQILNINYGDMIRVSGTSMLPAIQEGDWIVLAWGTQHKPVKGQVVAFKDILRGITIAHRVIEVGQDNKGWWARTKGDNNPETDPYLVRESNYLGVVWGIVRAY